MSERGESTWSRRQASGHWRQNRGPAAGWGTSREASERCWGGLLALLLALASMGFAETKTRTWAVALTGGGTEGTISVRETADGGAVIAGSAQGLIPGTEYTHALLIRLTSSGKVKWQTAFSCTCHDEQSESLYAATQLEDGGFAAVGLIYPRDHFGQALVMRLDKSGGIIWQKHVGGIASTAHDIQATSDGGFVVLAEVGYTSWARDLWLMKFDSGGTIEWQKTYGHRGPWEWGSRLLLTSDGGYFITCQTRSWYPLLMKLDSSGAIEWSKYIRFLVDVDDIITACELEDSGFVIAFRDLDWERPNTSDAYLIRLDSTGSLVWQKKFDSGGEDLPLGVIRTRDRNLVLVGSTRLPGSASRALLMKLDLDGTVIWQRTYGGAGPRSTGSSIYETADGGLLMGGNSNSFGGGDRDIWVLKLDSDGLLRGSCGIVGGANLQSSVTKLRLNDYSASVADTFAVPGVTEWTPVSTGLVLRRICGRSL